MTQQDVEERLRLSELIARKKLKVISHQENRELAEMLKHNLQLISITRELLGDEAKDILPTNRSKFYTKYKYWIGSAAAVAAILMGVIFYYYLPAIDTALVSNSQVAMVNPEETNNNDVNLILSHNEVVSLSNLSLSNVKLRKVSHLPNLKVSKNGIDYSNVTSADKGMDTGFHALQTDSTATYNVLLSDGTSITLNSNTVLRYPVVFYAHRDVWLEGEAYFQVHHESKRGFAVHAKGVKISVLGTKFNVKTTHEGNVEVCLTSGSVLVSTPHGEIRIKPGEKCVYTAATKEFEVVKFKRANELKWIGEKTLFHK